MSQNKVVMGWELKMSAGPLYLWGRGEKHKHFVSSQKNTTDSLKNTYIHKTLAMCLEKKSENTSFQSC